MNLTGKVDDFVQDLRSGGRSLKSPNDGSSDGVADLSGAFESMTGALSKLLDSH